MAGGGQASCEQHQWTVLVSRRAGGRYRGCICYVKAGQEPGGDTLATGLDQDRGAGGGQADDGPRGDGETVLTVMENGLYLAW